MKKSVLKKFGIAIRVRRLELGITQMKLAELAECSLQAVGNLERGCANPSLLMVHKIAEALQMQAKDLIS